MACGTGAHLPRFAERFDVAGVVLSADMLAIAGGRCPQATLTRSDMRDFDLRRRFDAVVCLFSSIGYLMEDADLGRAVTTMAQHLSSGGVLMIEGWIEPAHWLGSTVHAECGEAEGVAVARVTRSHREGHRCEVVMRYTAAMTDDIITIDEEHILRMSEPSEFEATFGDAGLSFERLPHMLHPGRSVYVGVVAGGDR